MKFSKLPFLAVLVLLTVIGFSYGYINPKFVELEKKDTDYLKLDALQKGQMTVWEIGTEDFRLSDSLATAHSELATFLADNSKGEWYVRFNKRINKADFIWGSGMKVLDKNTNVTRADLDKLGRRLIMKYYDLFPVKQENLVLDKITGMVANNPDKYFIRYSIMHNGIKLQRAFIFFRISYGNIIQIGWTGLEGWQWINANPSLANKKAIDIALAYAHMNTAYKVVAEPQLKIIATSSNPFVTAKAEEKAEYKLVYELQITYQGVMGTWLTWVDANTGEVILFADNNRYERKGRVMGGIYPLSVDTNLDVVPGENCSGTPDEDTQVYMPFAHVPLRGIPVVDPVSSMGGFYSFNGIGQASCSMDGLYFAGNDEWFSSNAEVYAYSNDELDLGTGGVDFLVTSMLQDPTTGGLRNAYFHLNRARDLAKQWLPTLDWLDSDVALNVNLDQQCNAYWSGAEGSVNFFVSTCLLLGACSPSWGMRCNNTGEISGVMMHEWGHGIDANMGTGSGDIATSEGVGDTVSFFNTHDDCLAPGFVIANQCCVYPPCNDATPAAYMANAACRAKGSLRSSENYEDQYWTSVVEDADATTTNLLDRCRPCTNYYCGPLSREGHCEGTILPEAIWDIAKALQSDPKHLTNGGWKYAEYLFFGAIGFGAEVYLSIIPDNYYDAMLAADDDDGNLPNGTPHATLIHDNYGIHDLYVPAALPNSTHCTQPAQPVLTGTIVSDGVQLTWTPVSGADHYILYWLYLNSHGPAYVIYEGAGTTYTYQTTVPGTWYFAVQAISANGCPSPMENVVSKTLGSGYPDLKISSVTLHDDAPNGNGDGYGDVGETVDLAIILTNHGNINATGLSVKLNVLGEGITLMQDTSAYPDIAPGASQLNTTPFRMYLTKEMKCGGDIRFSLSIMTNERLMSAKFTKYMGSMTNVYFNNFEVGTGSGWSFLNDSHTDASMQRIPAADGAPWYNYPHSPHAVVGWNNDPITANDDSIIFNTSAFWSTLPANEYIGLDFWHTYCAEETHETLTLELSTDNGVTWTDLGSTATTGGYNTSSCDFASKCWSFDNTGGCMNGSMTEVLVDLVQYAGKTPAPRIKWRARSNATCDYWGCAGDYNTDGWFIDDVAFKKCTIIDRGKLTLDNTAIDDSGGNHNGTLDQGETVNVILTLKNESASIDFSNVSGTLISDTPGITIIDGEGVFGDIVHGATQDNSTDPFTIKYLGPCKDKLTLQLNIHSDQGDFVLSVSIPVGVVTTWSDDVEAPTPKPQYSITVPNSWKIYTGGPPFTTSGNNAWYIDNFNWGTEYNLKLAANLTANSHVELLYNHTFAFEDLYDGVRLLISDDLGATWTDVGPYITSGGYNDAWAYDGDPIWTDAPFVWGHYSPPPTPTWQKVVVDLSDWAGETVVLRWWQFSDANADSCAEAGGGYNGPPCGPWPLSTWGDGYMMDDLKITAQSCNYCALPEFTDTTTNFAKSYIRKLQCSGVASGCSPTQYCPGNTVTRDAMSKFLLKSEEISPAASCTGVFTDVQPSNPFCPYIEKLAQLAIASGCSATQFCPSNSVTREQMAAFMFRALGYTPSGSCTGMFNDVPSGNPFCVYIEEIANQGITSGCTSNLYCPANSVLRDQMSVFLVRAFNL